MFAGAGVDARLDRRGEHLVDAMAQRKSAVVHQCCPTHREQMGAYRFLRNPDVTEAEMVAAIRRQCAKPVTGRHVLAIHDTSSLDFQAHAGQLFLHERGLGPLECPSQVGFFLHPILVLDASQPFPLGSADVHRWNRSWKPPTKTERRYQPPPFEMKESGRWVQGGRDSQCY